MNEIRILIRIAARSAEPNLAFFLVDPLHATDDELALGDLVADCPLLSIDQVQLPPAVLLRRVDDLIGLLQPSKGRNADVLGVSGPNERVGLFVDQIAAGARAGIDLDQSQSLMAPIDLLIRERV